MNAAQADCMSTSSPSPGATATLPCATPSFSVPRGSIAALVGVNGSGNPRCLKR